MPVTPYDITRDINGLVAGEWRLYHDNPDFNLNFGPFGFVNGVTNKPLTGRALLRLVVAYGGKLALAEPWDKPIRKRPFGPTVEKAADRERERPIPDARAEPTTEQEGVVMRATEPDELEDLDKDQLIARADAMGVDVDRRWGAPRVRDALRKGV